MAITPPCYFTHSFPRNQHCAPLHDSCMTNGYRTARLLPFVVVVQDAPIRQRHIGDEMMGAHDLAHRKIGNRRIDMRHEMQPARSNPRALYGDVGEIVGDELADLGMTV